MNCQQVHSVALAPKPSYTEVGVDMAKAAELGHSRHTKPLGWGPYHIPDRFSFVVWDARQHFLDQLPHHAPAVLQSLFRLFRQYHRGDLHGVPDQELHEWVGRSDLTRGGQCPDWLLTSVREAEVLSLPGIPYLYLRWPHDTHHLYMRFDETRLHLPKLFWSPFSPSLVYDLAGKITGYKNAGLSTEAGVPVMPLLRVEL